MFLKLTNHSLISIKKKQFILYCLFFIVSVFSFNSYAQVFSKQNPYYTHPVQSFQKTKFYNNSRISSAEDIKNNLPCWDKAAAYHHVDPWLLYSIAYVESNYNAKAINYNKNGSYDYGLMQINSSWFPKLKSLGISVNSLSNKCVSIYVGAWILSKNFKNYGNTWRAIGAYNSSNPYIGLRYAKSVYRAHTLLLNKIEKQK